MGLFGTFLPGNVGGSFGFRFNFSPSATCDLPDGDGPPGDGLSSRLIVQNSRH
jgi:hypothetical protein